MKYTSYLCEIKLKHLVNGIDYRDTRKISIVFCMTVVCILQSILFVLSSVFLK